MMRCHCTKDFTAVSEFCGLHYVNLMPQALPHFKYHTEPLRTGSVETSGAMCVCCSRQTGYVYVAPVYSTHMLDDSLCPWCIADGSAAAKFGASFTDEYSLHSTGVPASVIEEVSQRTPSYSSWQQEEWLAHCNDACDFQGDATVEDVLNVSDQTKQAWFDHYSLSQAEWDHITINYVPGGHQALHKFVCLHCRVMLFAWNCA
jgi:uncharacterized protein